MYLVNRSLILIKPKEPYVNWANSTAQSYETIDEIRESSKAILLPIDIYDNQEAFLEENFKVIFELELDAWLSDKRLWPRQIDYETFKKWFDVEFYSLVVDFSESELSRELYG